MSCTSCGRSAPEVSFYRESRGGYKRKCKQCYTKVVLVRANRLGLNRKRTNPFAALEAAMGKVPLQRGRR